MAWGMGWGRTGNWGLRFPHWSYLLRHRGLYHTSCIGLQAVIVVAICAQVQIGPPEGDREDIQSTAGTLAKPPPQPVSQRDQASAPAPFFVSVPFSNRVY